MQSTEGTELRISSYGSPQKAMYQIKEFLLQKETADISSGTSSSGTAARAIETLKRLGYITVQNVKTLKLIQENMKDYGLAFL